MKFDFNEVFPKPMKKKRNMTQRVYDVYVSTNTQTNPKTSTKRVCIRFSFHNKAVEVFCEHAFIQRSPIVNGNRIYFYSFDKKEHTNIYKISHSGGHSIRISPDKNEEKSLRKWVNKGYMLQFDEENQWYFIENEKVY